MISKRSASSAARCAQESASRPRTRPGNAFCASSGRRRSSVVGTLSASVKCALRARRLQRLEVARQHEVRVRLLELAGIGGGLLACPSERWRHRRRAAAESRRSRAVTPGSASSAPQVAHEGGTLPRATAPQVRRLKRQHAVRVEAGIVRCSARSSATSGRSRSAARTTSATSAITTPLRSMRPPPSAAVRPAARSTSIESGRDARERRHDPEDARARQRRPRASRTPSTGIDRAPRRAAAGSSGRERDQQVDAEPREAEPEQRAARGEQQALGQHLPHQPPRLPPSAARTASSRSRAAARTSSRFATFAHAISSTNTTAPISASIAGLTSATRSSCIGSTRKCRPAVCLIGNRSRRSAASASTLRCACRTETPGLSRADHAHEHVDARCPREVDAERGPESGARSTLVPGGNSSSKPGASTPTISDGCAAEIDRAADHAAIAAVAPLPEPVAENPVCGGGGGGVDRAAAPALRRGAGCGGGGGGAPSASLEVAAERHPRAEHPKQIGRDVARRRICSGSPSSPGTAAGPW